MNFREQFTKRVDFFSCVFTLVHQQSIWRILKLLQIHTLHNIQRDIQRQQQQYQQLFLCGESEIIRTGRRTTNKQTVSQT